MNCKKEDELLRPKIKNCVFQVTRSCLIFWGGSIMRKGLLFMKRSETEFQYYEKDFYNALFNYSNVVFQSMEIYYVFLTVPIWRCPVLSARSDIL